MKETIEIDVGAANGVKPLVECRAVFETSDDGTFSVYAENLPGVISYGDTLDEAVENIKAAFRLTIEEYRDLGVEPPFEDVRAWRDSTGERQQRWFLVDVG